MINLNLKHEPLTLAHVSPSDFGPEHRLIVLVPDPEADLTSVTRRVWRLAHATGAQVLFLGLCNDAQQEPALRRTLVTASALMNSASVTADLEIFVGKDWLGIVRSHVRPSDMIVLCQESTSQPHQKMLTPILQADLDVPVYIVSGAHPRKASRTEWLPAAAAWVGSLTIVIAFFWLQVKIDQLAGQWSIPLQLVSITFEFALIWIWNNRFK